MYIIYFPLTLILLYFLYNRYLHPLSSIPGPFLASISPLWLVYQMYRRRRPRLDIRLHATYGPLVRISPTEVIFSNPAYFKPVYGAGTRFTKSRFYEATGDRAQADQDSKDVLNMLPEMDVEKLRLQKRMAGMVYSERNLRRHEGHVDANVERMFKRFGGMVGRERGSVDVYYELELMNVDTMCEITYGRSFGAVEKGSDGGHMESMEAMFHWWAWIGYLPWLNEIDKSYAPWAKIFTKYVNKALNLPVFPYVFGEVAAYDSLVQAGGKPTPCILDDLRNTTNSHPEFRFNWGTRMSVTDLGAGVDTITWTIAAFLVGIGQTPRVAAKLHAELDAAVQSGRFSKDEPIPYDQAIGLEYFQACIHETMRMWPNVAISLPRDVPEDGMTLEGRFIPSGYTVGMNSKVLGLNTEIFGADAHEFRPERWIEADKARREMMENRNLAFGGASRRCPGIHLAWFVMTKVLASLCLNFEVRLLNEMDGPPGPGGHVWRELGSFPAKWHGLEVEILRR